MIQIIIKRLFWAFFLSICISFLCFCLLYFAKGSVVFAKMPQASSITKRQMEENLDLHKPLLEQYFTWLTQALKGDFSYSLISGEKVSALFLELLPNTLLLSFSAFFLVILLSLFLGVISVIYRESFLDKCIAYFTMGIFAMPTFAFSLLLIMFFSIYLDILPSSGVSDLGFENDLGNRILHLILPLVVLTLTHFAIYVRFVRASVIDSLNSSFVEGILARGIGKIRLYFYFVLKHSLGPILSYFGASSIAFVASIYVVESIFAYGGIGNLFIKSIVFKDYPIVLLMVVFSVVFVIFINLAVEIINHFINPRLQYIKG